MRLSYKYCYWFCCLQWPGQIGGVCWVSIHREFNKGSVCICVLRSSRFHCGHVYRTKAASRTISLLRWAENILPVKVCSCCAGWLRTCAKCPSSELFLANLVPESRAMFVSEFIVSIYNAWYGQDKTITNDAFINMRISSLIGIVSTIYHVCYVCWNTKLHAAAPQDALLFLRCWIDNCTVQGNRKRLTE
jgi:hypothetical protein